MLFLYDVQEAADKNGEAEEQKKHDVTLKGCNSLQR
jgi:hypothetical protein